MYSKMYNKVDMENGLRELSRELKREFGRGTKHEIVIVGGAAIVLKHNFRESSSDIDALVSDGSSIKMSIQRTAERLGLNDDWLNSDFKQSSSYSKRLIQVSDFYKTYNQILDVRVVRDEYLIAMKMKSFRTYKNDKSDIIGLLQENTFTYGDIENAVIDLYGKKHGVKREAWDFLMKYFASDGVEYQQIRDEEINSRSILVEFEGNYENVLKEDNVEKILELLREKAKKQ